MKHTPLEPNYKLDRPIAPLKPLKPITDDQYDKICVRIYALEQKIAAYQPIFDLSEQLDMLYEQNREIKKMLSELKHKNDE